MKARKDARKKTPADARKVIKMENQEEKKPKQEQVIAKMSVLDAVAADWHTTENIFQRSDLICSCVFAYDVDEVEMANCLGIGLFELHQYYDLCCLSLSLSEILRGYSNPPKALDLRWLGMQALNNDEFIGGGSMSRL